MRTSHSVSHYIISMHNDNYTHAEKNVFYITENIMGPSEKSTEYEKLFDNYNSQYDEHCTCKDICSKGTCKCLRKSCDGNYLTYQENGRLKYKLKPEAELFPVLECNENCPCSTECGNRVVQMGPVQDLEIRTCDKGYGLFTTCSIPSGTFICEYAGEIITKNEALIRHRKNKALGMRNYIFYLKELATLQPLTTIIDPSVFGNIGRYINHSCEPNCHVVPVRCGSPIPKLGIFAHADILANEEITFHYGLNDECNLNTSQTGADRITCLCKSKGCAGYMPFHVY